VKTPNRKEVHWHINYFCNYSCSYCFYGSGQKNAFRGSDNIETIVESFDKTESAWLINITGGEPFFSPRFIELCLRLSRRHVISLNTNLSHPNVIRFAERMDPDRVGYIHCGLHIQECEKNGLIDDFVKRFRLLKGKGFYVFASYVMFPSLLNRFEKEFQRFKKEGIVLRPKIFRGRAPLLKTFIGRAGSRYFSRLQREYPKGYSKKQREELLFYINRSQNAGDFFPLWGQSLPDRGLVDVGLDRFFTGGLVSFLGKSCDAGLQCGRMTPEGDVFRCHGSSRYLGNLFKGSLNLFDQPLACPYDLCLCPYLGLKYAGRNRINGV